MKWETVTSTIGQSVYALWNNGRKLVTLVFHPSSGAARLEYEDKKRVFLIRKEGLLKNKTVLRNEYGILVGQAGTENKENFITINDQRFFYTAGDSPETAFTIYQESKDHPIVVCALDKQQQSSLPELRANKPLQEKVHYGLLMGICWYLFQPVEKEAALEFA